MSFTKIFTKAKAYGIGGASIAGVLGYLRSEYRHIQLALTKKSGGKTTYTLEFEDSQLVDDHSFFVDIKEFDGNVPAQQVAGYLQDVLTTELQKHYGDSASVTVDLIKVKSALGNGKAKAGLELKDDEGTTYSVTVQNDQKIGKYPVIYCPGVTIVTGEPFFNTWFTSPTPIALGVSSTISWTVTYSVSLCQVILQAGKTVTTQVSEPVALGQRVTFSLKGGVPTYSPPVKGDDPKVIQVYLEPSTGVDFESWAVGFGIADPNGKDNPVMVVQADADTYYNFTPTPHYKVGLASTNHSNKLVDESELTSCAPVSFTGNTTSVTVEHKVDGSWYVNYPSASAIVSKPQVALKLIKKTVTSTTIEEYA